MKYLLLITAALTIGSTESANAKIVSQSQNLIVTLSKDLPEAVRSAGQSMVLHSISNGNTYLYVEQNMGKRLAILNVTDPGHIKSVGLVMLDSPWAFDFVRDLDGSSTLICFRDNRGAAIMEFKRAKQPTIVIADGLRQAHLAESIGRSGLLMVAEPRQDVDIVAFDYQVVDTSDPHRLKLLATVPRVQKRVTYSTTGAIYLLGADGLTVVRQPSIEEKDRLESTSN